MELNQAFLCTTLPTLDLHGLDRQTASLYIRDFLSEQYKMKNPIVVIVHGNGSGILRSTTIDVLKKSILVEEFKSSYFNQGCTYVKIKIKKRT